MSATWHVRRAGESDLPDVVMLLNEAAQRLHDNGIEQWGPGWMSNERMAPPVRRGEVFLVRDHSSTPVATVMLTETPDADFWTPQEQTAKALYLAKLARTDAVSGVGTWLLRWSVDHAARQGYRCVRLDAWATNPALHEYYRLNGWTYLRTVDLPWRQSGALFEHAAIEDLAAREVFAEQF